MIKVVLTTIENCARCEKVRKTLDRLKKEYPKLIVEIYPVTTEPGAQLVKQYRIAGAPGIIINDKLIKIGEMSEKEFKQEFDSL